VYQYRTDTGEEMGRIRVAQQPTGMVISSFIPEGSPEGMRHRLFVTTAATNDVQVIGIDATKLMRSLDVFSIGFAAVQPRDDAVRPGAERQSTKLFIACSDVNAVAVVDVTESRGRLAGFLPTAPIPTVRTARAVWPF
jgi:hypothetical protein